MGTLGISTFIHKDIAKIFELCNILITFCMVNLGEFSDFVHDCLLLATRKRKMRLEKRTNMENKRKNDGNSSTMEKYKS